MNNLREEIAKIAYEAGGQEAEWDDALIASDRILALISKPTGLVRVSKCPMCKGATTVITNTIVFCTTCPTCHGTGTIRTPLTQEEAVEIAHKLVEYNTILLNHAWVFTNGDRIEIEGE